MLKSVGVFHILVRCPTSGAPPLVGRAATPFVSREARHRSRAANTPQYWPALQPINPGFTATKDHRNAS
jgi:hypothetical protein